MTGQREARVMGTRSGEPETYNLGSVMFRSSEPGQGNSDQKSWCEWTPAQVQGLLRRAQVRAAQIRVVFATVELGSRSFDHVLLGGFAPIRNTHCRPLKCTVLKIHAKKKPFHKIFEGKNRSTKTHFTNASWAF